MDYIDPLKWPAIADYSYADNHTVEVQAAIDDAAGGSAVGIGGEVTFPAGGFVIGEAQTYRQQYIHGAWQSTIIKQVEDKSVFVTKEWAANETHFRLGRFWENLSFITDDATAGGYAILDFGYRDQMRSVHSTGLPIGLTSITKDGTYLKSPGVPITTGNHAMDSIHVVDSPRGGIVTTGKVTDCPLTRSTFNGCGALGGAAVLEVTSLAGWQMETLKIFSGAGKVINCTGSIWNATLLGSMIDWPGGDSVGLDFHNINPGEQGIRMIGNDLRILATEAGDYTMVSIHGSDPARAIHLGNKYWIDPVVAAVSTVNAILLDGTTYSGSSGHNDYQGFGPNQRGNADALLGPPITLLGP